MKRLVLFLGNYDNLILQGWLLFLLRICRCILGGNLVDNGIYMEQSMKSKGLFLNKNFTLLFFGKLISKIGDSVYLFAMTWYMFDVYKSPFLASIVIMLGVIPTVILGPFAGVIADRFKRKKIIVLMDFIQAAALMGVALLDYFDMLHLYYFFIVAVILGVCGTLFNPACTAIIPNIVEKENLAKANSLDTMITSSSNILGILGGGLMYSILGFATITLLNTLSFLVSGILEMLLVLPAKETLTESPSDTQIKKDPIAKFMLEMTDGYKYLKSQTALFKLFIYTTAFNFLFAPFYPIYLPFIMSNLIKAAASYLA